MNGSYENELELQKGSEIRMYHIWKLMKKERGQLMNAGTYTLCGLNYILERHIWMCERQIYVCSKVGGVDSKHNQNILGNGNLVFV